MSVLKDYWIYAFHDDRYDSGVKIGIANNRRNRFQFSQGYSPGEIKCLGTWKYQTDKAGIEEIERSILTHFPQWSRPHAGSEWIDIETKDAIHQISEFLAKKRANDFNGNVSKNDAIHTNVPTITLKGRAVLWIFQENETDRLKVTCLCDWSTPLEETRAYSRLGFKPVAAFIDKTEISQAANDRLYENHAIIIRKFSNANPLNHHWLKPGLEIDKVTSFIASLDANLEALPPSTFTPENRPKCVAVANNEPLNLDDPEFSPLRDDPQFL